LPRRIQPPRPLLERLLIATVVVCIAAMLLMALIATGRGVITAAPGDAKAKTYLAPR